eukprot:NODE_322_length_2411_cov_12.565674_g300_i0.p1 GENE.NODE_322_length_2411_cov_12.565674_g300_i0~~NODE_322_length_2411_cov_12.565674_g300_i0.p1  ORF type:complete len:781 (+),score=235.05 NODE_322_length_2411_cov_12.565674_g300_i0:18-2360(+)
MWRSHAGPYIIDKTLGEGAYSKVKLATHSKTGARVAIKVMKMASLQTNASMMRTVQREIVLLSLMRHPNVCQMYDVIQTKTKLFVVLEYVPGGDLWARLKNHNKLTIEEAFRYYYSIIAALDYCHACCICHRDLKPENILVDDNGNIKVADFGLAGLLIRDQPMETRCGSIQYAAPELLKKPAKYDGTKADVWSSGVVLFVLCAGVVPFEDEHIGGLVRKIRTANYTVPFFFPDALSSFLAKLLVTAPKLRSSIADMKTHPFWRDMCDKLGLDPAGPPLPTEAIGLAALPTGASLDFGGSFCSLNSTFTLSSPRNCRTPVSRKEEDASMEDLHGMFDEGKFKTATEEVPESFEPDLDDRRLIPASQPHDPLIQLTTGIVEWSDLFGRFLEQAHVHTTTQLPSEKQLSRLVETMTKQAISEAQAHLHKQAWVGTEVSARVIQFYSDMLTTTLALFATLVTSRPIDNEFLSNMNSFFFFLSLQEHVGVERLIVASVLAAGHFTLAAFVQFVSVLKAQDVMEKAFRERASNHFLHIFETQKDNGGWLSHCRRIESIFIQLGPLQPASTPHTREWFFNMAKRMDVLSTISTELAAAIMNSAPPQLPQGGSFVRPSDLQELQLPIRTPFEEDILHVLGVLGFAEREKLEFRLQQEEPLLEKALYRLLSLQRNSDSQIPFDSMCLFPLSLDTEPPGRTSPGGGGKKGFFQTIAHSLRSTPSADDMANGSPRSNRFSPKRAPRNEFSNEDFRTAVHSAGAVPERRNSSKLEALEKRSFASPRRPPNI